MCALMIVIGWNPTPILTRMEASVQAVLERVEANRPPMQASAPVELATEPVVTTASNDDETGDAPVAADDE